MDPFSSFLGDLWATAKANLISILAFAGTAVTALYAFRTKSQETRSADKKTDVDLSRIVLDRDRATDERFDRLVAHLERQLETMDKKLDRANETIDEQAREISWLKRKMIALDTHIGRLGDMIVGMGGTPPVRPRDPPRDD